MGGPTAQLDLTLSDAERSNSRPLRSHKENELGHMLLLNTNMKSYVES